MYVGSCVDQQQRFTEVHTYKIHVRYVIGCIYYLLADWSRSRSDSEPS